MKAIELNAQVPYATESELQYLTELAQRIKPLQVVMLGAGPGVMLLAVLEGSPPTTNAIVIDIADTHYTRAHLEVNGYGVTEYIGDSAQHGIAYDGPPINLLIVDADHSYMGVSKDIKAWLFHMAPGGYVFFHDYDDEVPLYPGAELYPGVKQAVDQYMPSVAQLVCRVGTAIVYKVG